MSMDGSIPVSANGLRPIHPDVRTRPIDAHGQHRPVQHQVARQCLTADRRTRRVNHQLVCSATIRPGKVQLDRADGVVAAEDHRRPRRAVHSHQHEAGERCGGAASPIRGEIPRRRRRGPSHRWHPMWPAGIPPNKTRRPASDVPQIVPRVATVKPHGHRIAVRTSHAGRILHPTAIRLEPPTQVRHRRRERPRRWHRCRPRRPPH